MERGGVGLVRPAFFTMRIRCKGVAVERNREFGVSRMRQVAVVLAMMLLCGLLVGCAPPLIHPGAHSEDIYSLPPGHQDHAYGQKVAGHLQKRYDETNKDCGGYNSPLILCSGVLFRGTVSSTQYHAWNPNPANPKGSVSFSWIRHDAQFKSMYTARYTHGFVFLPKFYSDDPADGYYQIEVLCGFPVDGQTDARDQLGCGRHSSYQATSRPCLDQGIDSGAKYAAYYRPAPLYAYVCSFPFAKGTSNTAHYFTLLMDSIRALGGQSFDYWNEILVRQWPQNIHKGVPIEAFFYQAGTNGLAGAIYDQADYFRMSGRWVPVIRFNMPASIGARATFVYERQNQSTAGIDP